MPKIKHNDQKREWTIYLLRAQNDKKFLVGYCLKESLRETYRHNLKGRREASKDFMEAIYPERPCLFVLEDFLGTTQEATRLLIVWIKIFVENGYKSYNREVLLEMIEHLYIDTKTEYEKRKLMDLDTLVSCSKCKVPTYNKQTCSNYPGV